MVVRLISWTVLPALLATGNLVHAQSQNAKPSQPQPVASVPAAPLPSSVVSPKVRNNVPKGGGVSSADFALIYGGGTVLEAAKASIGYPVEFQHRENWLIANGRYAFWGNTITFIVNGPQVLSEAGAEKLRALLAKPGCLVLIDSKGAKLLPPSKITRTNSQVIAEWDPITITDKSRSPKTLHLPWGQITLLDRVDLIIPSALSTNSSC